MATLVNEELFDYLDHLNKEVDKRISMSNERSLQYLMHSQMKSIIENERDFLKYINSNGTQSILSISSNGLPSVASLNPDLEKICELAEEEKSFSDVTQKFRKGIDGKNRGEKEYSYVPVSEDEWSKELKNRGGKKLQSQVGFAISETEDGKFELAVREDVHLQGYDQYSKEFPILIREGRMKYHVVWNKLLEDSEESFYVPSSSTTIQIIRTSKQFNDLSRFYSFNKQDYKSYNGRMPLLFWGSWTPKNYSEFLSAGSNARVNIANNVLETLSKALGRKVNFKGINKNDLKVVLDFYTIPFKNDPQTTLKETDLFEFYCEYNNNSRNKIASSKYPTKFDLIFTNGGDKMGQIEYFLPRNVRYSNPINHKYNYNFPEYGYSKHWYDGYRFCLGLVKLDVLGSAIYDENQFAKVQEGLKKIHLKTN